MVVGILLIPEEILSSSWGANAQRGTKNSSIDKTELILSAHLAGWARQGTPGK